MGQNRKALKSDIESKNIPDIAECLPKMREKTNQVIVVHLGNMGHFVLSEDVEKTRECASDFPEVYFYGIDIRCPNVEPMENFAQIQADFKSGLLDDRINDGSVSIISSELSLGYYDRQGNEVIRDPEAGSESPEEMEVKEYTIQTLQAAYEKLRRGGKVMLVVDRNTLDFFMDAFTHTPFMREKIKSRPLKPHEYERTIYTRLHEHRDVNPLIQLIAIK